ncbi:hypothetical protein Emag_002402 [Eimeria magna]
MQTASKPLEQQQQQQQQEQQQQQQEQQLPDKRSSAPLSKRKRSSACSACSDNRGGPWVYAACPDHHYPLQCLGPRPRPQRRRAPQCLDSCPGHGLGATSCSQLHATDAALALFLTPRSLTKGKLRADPLARAPYTAHCSSSSCSSSSKGGEYPIYGAADTPQCMHGFGEYQGPTSASESAESLQTKPGRPWDRAAYTPEINSGYTDTSDKQQKYISHAPSLPPPPPFSKQQQQQQQQRGYREEEGGEEEGLEGLGRMASSLYTSALNELRSFVGLTGEDIQGSA